MISANNHTPDDLGAFREALALYREALGAWEQLAAGQPPSALANRRLAGVHVRVANSLAAIGRKTEDRAAFTECFKHHDQAVALLEAGARAEPGNARLRRSVAAVLVDRASARAEARENLEGGIEDCRRALETSAALAAADPSNAEAQQDLNSAHYAFGVVLRAQGARAAAAEEFRCGLAILAPLVSMHPANVETAFDLHRTRQALADTEGMPELASPPPTAQNLERIPGPKR